MAVFELDGLASYDEESLVAELRRVAAIVASPFLTAAEFDRHSKASSSVVRRRFDGWANALARAGLEDRFSGGVGTRGRKPRDYTDDELLAELRAISQTLGGAPVTVELFNQHARMNAETVRRRFNGWWNALKKANLPISNLGKRYSDSEYFENLLTVWTYYGRQPKYSEMDRQPSAIPAGAYEAKWRTWRKSLLAFLDRVNSDVQSQSSNQTLPASSTDRPSSKKSRRRNASSREDERNISLGLRYDVLRRDRFRCVLCGASPATQLNCLLHIDHVVPWSKGGKTIASNLRTLCQPCNLGKSAKE